MQPAGVVYVISAVPALTPLITPVVRAADAMEGAVLLQVPPGAALVSSVALPWHMVGVPPIGDIAFTVTVAVAMQPAGVVYLMIALPGPAPVTTPVDKPTVATPGDILLHVPPGVASDNVVVVPWQIILIPVIGDIGFTVRVVVAMQPEGVA